MSADTDRKDIWDKLHAIGPFIGGVGVPLVIAWVGNSYSAAIKDSENRVKYVEIALAVLRSAPKDETEALRAWAIELLDSQSPVKLDPEAREQLKRYRVLVGSIGGVGGSGGDSGGDAGGGVGVAGSDAGSSRPDKGISGHTKKSISNPRPATPASNSQTK